MKFAKLHGTGNDFILVRPENEVQDWPVLAKQACDRHFGIGADGLILALPSQRADVRMRIFNPDGSEAEMCGNGIRCLSKFAVESGIVQPKEGRITVDTLSGVLDVELMGKEGRVERARIAMGRPRFAPGDLPALIEAEPPILNFPLEVAGRVLNVSCLSMGNPHAVYLQEEPVAEFPLETIGPKVERHPLFPQRVNFEVARILGRDKAEMRVWERGAGPTLACGSGACATMVAAQLQELVGHKVDITVPGGILTIEWDGQGDVYLSGPVELVYEGEWKI